jgi:hypothetical protein
MKIRFHGAAGDVTGSAYHVVTDQAKRRERKKPAQSKTRRWKARCGIADSRTPRPHRSLTFVNSQWLQGSDLCDATDIRDSYIDS